MNIRKKLALVLLALSPITSFAAMLEGTVAGAYAGAVVCLDADRDLYCDTSAHVTSDADGQFVLDTGETPATDGWVIAKITPEANRIGPTGLTPVQRPLWFAAEVAASVRISALSSVVNASISAGLSHEEAVAQVAADYQVEDPAALLTAPAEIASPQIRAQVQQAENNAAEDIRLALEAWSIDEEISTAYVTFLTSPAEASAKVQCDRMVRDPATGYWHTFWQLQTMLEPDVPNGIHLVLADFSDPRQQPWGWWQSKRILAWEAVLCSDQRMTVTGRALGAELFSGAEVCLDASGDGSCTDEASAYRTIADASGAYLLLNLPKNLLAERNLLAIAPAMPEAPLKTPGIMAIVNEGKAMLSPSLSLAAHYAELNGSSFALAYRALLDSFGLPEELNLSQLDYGAPEAAGNPSARAFAVFDELLLTDVTYAAFLTNDLPISGVWLEQIKQTFAETQGEAWNTALDFAALEQLFADKLWYSGYFEEDSDMEPGLANNAVMKSNAMMANALNPVETYQEVLDAADLSNGIRQTAIDAIGAIPVAGPLVSTFLDLVWPEETGVKELLGLLYQDVNRLITQHIAAAVVGQYKAGLSAIRLAMAEFKQPNQQPANQKEHFDTAFNRAKELLDHLAVEDQYGHQAIPVYVQTLLARMSLHREKLAHPELWNSNETEASVRERFRSDYVKYRDFLFHGGEGVPSLFERYKNWRWENIIVERGVTEPPWVYTTGDVRDEVSNFKIHYELHIDDCDGEGLNCFSEDVAFVRNRLFNEAKLNFAKVTAAAMLLPRLLPEDLLSSTDTRDDATERQADHLKRYYVPEELKDIEVGPYSEYCMEYQSRYAAGDWQGSRPRCKAIIVDTDRYRSETSYGSAHGMIDSAGPGFATVCQFRLTNRTGNELSYTRSWRYQDCNQSFSIIPPNTNYTLTGIGLDFRSSDEIHPLRFFFERRDPDRPEHPVLYQPAVPDGYSDVVAWTLDGSLDYQVSGGVTGKVMNFEYQPFLYFNFGFFPDSDSQQRAP
jgi:hypothetical protein